MIEKHVKQAAKALLTEIGAFQYWPVPMGFQGHSVDCFFCYRGGFYAMETKRPGIYDVTDRQQLVLLAVAKAGGGAIVENSVGLESLRAVLGIN